MPDIKTIDNMIKELYDSPSKKKELLIICMILYNIMAIEEGIKRVTSPIYFYDNTKTLY